MVSRSNPLSDDERSMTWSNDFLVFSIEGRKCALPLTSVDRIVRAAAVTPLPNAPTVVIGALDLEGAVLPVLSLRRRFSFPDREVRVTDQFLIARTQRQPVILVIDQAQEVRQIGSEQITHSSDVVPGLHGHTRGVAALEDGLVLIHDLDAFLSLEEAATLEAALQEREASLAK